MLLIVFIFDWEGEVIDFFNSKDFIFHTDECLRSLPENFWIGNHIIFLENLLKDGDTGFLMFINNSNDFTVFIRKEIKQFGLRSNPIWKRFYNIIKYGDKYKINLFKKESIEFFDSGGNEDFSHILIRFYASISDLFLDDYDMDNDLLLVNIDLLIRVLNTFYYDVYLEEINNSWEDYYNNSKNKGEFDTTPIKDINLIKKKLTNSILKGLQKKAGLFNVNQD